MDPLTEVAPAPCESGLVGVSGVGTWHRQAGHDRPTLGAMRTATARIFWGVTLTLVLGAVALGSTAVVADVLASGLNDYAKIWIAGVVVIAVLLVRVVRRLLLPGLAMRRAGLVQAPLE